MKILCNSQNISTYFVLNHWIRCIYSFHYPLNQEKYTYVLFQPLLKDGRCHDTFIIKEVDMKFTKVYKQIHEEEW